MKEKKFRRDNRGSSLVVVIVIVAFISILATILLYMSGSNFIMKKTDQNNKANFYKAETAMEEIKAGLVLLASEASNEAYVDAMVEYSVDDSYTRYSIYQQRYFEELQSLLADKVSAQGDFGGYITSLVEPDLQATVSVDDINISQYLDSSKVDDGLLYIKGINVLYTEDSFTTVIESDFAFSVPEMNWHVNTSYVDLESEIADDPSDRDKYDIADYVDYSNWKKN